MLLNNMTLQVFQFAFEPVMYLFQIILAGLEVCDLLIKFFLKIQAFDPLWP